MITTLLVLAAVALVVIVAVIVAAFRLAGRAEEDSEPRPRDQDERR